MEVNTGRKTRMEPRKRLEVNIDNFPETSTAKLVSNVITCIFLDPIGTAERWVHVFWAAYGLHIS